MASPVKDAKLKAQQIWAGATVHRRGKGSIVHRHPTNPLRKMLDTQVGNIGWHFGDGPFTDAHEVDTAWVDADPILDAPWQKKMVLADYNAYAFREPTLQFDQGQLIEYRDPVSGEAVAFQPQELEWTNDLDQISQISAPAAVAATIDDDMLTWADAYGSGIDFQWETQTARLMKYVNIAGLADLGSPPQFIIDGGNPVLRVELLFQKSSNIEIWVDGAEWDELPNNPQETLDNVEFRLASTGETVWWFKTPKAWGSILLDEDPQEISPIMRIRKSGPSLFVEILTPWSWLETATYPVVIDATVDYQVGASADDGQEKTAASANITNVGILNDDDDEWTGLRFTGVTIPSGATINADTYLDFVLHTAATLDEPYHTFYAEDSSTPPVFAAVLGNLSNRTSTTATITFGDGNDRGMSVGDWYSVTGKCIVQTIIAELELSYDYSSGLAMAFLATCVTTNGQDDFAIYAYDGSTTLCAKLHIDYTEASGDKNIDPTPEAVTVGESVTIDPLLLADVSETEDVTVGDTPTLELASYISEQDDVTVGDTATVDPVSPTEISETEPVTVGDAATLDPLLLADVSETEDVTVGDTATIDALLIEVSESEAVTVDEDVTLGPVAPTEISELDAVTVTDTPTVQIPSDDEWNVSEQDDVTVGDVATLGPVTPTNIDESDAVTVGETVTVDALTIDISQSDGITVVDTATLSPVSPTEISELEAVTVTDTPTVQVPADDEWYISESDGITVGDTATLGPVTPTEISEIEAVTVVDAATVAFFQPVLTLSVGDAVTVVDLSTVAFPSDQLGLDKPEKKPYEYQKEFLDMEPVVRPLDPAFAMRQEQKSIMKANAVAESLMRQNEHEAARRVAAMLSREKADKDRADRRRASSLHNLAKAQIAKEAKEQRQAEINKARNKNLKKARAAKKRKAKKKK